MIGFVGVDAQTNFGFVQSHPQDDRIEKCLNSREAWVDFPHKPSSNPHLQSTIFAAISGLTSHASIVSQKHQKRSMDFQANFYFYGER